MDPLCIAPGCVSLFTPSCMETVFGNIECLNLAEKAYVHLKTDLVKVAVLVAFHCFIKNLSRSIIIFHTAT